MKIILIYPPFCTPASPPYSITKIASYLKQNTKLEITTLDLNLEFHKLKFPEFQKYYSEKKWDDYEEKTKEYMKLTSKCYSENNFKIRNNKEPELFNELLNIIQKEKADYIAFSVVYSSQAFYTYALLKQLNNTIIGGPAINKKLSNVATYTHTNPKQVLELLNIKEKSNKEILEFQKLKDYFTPKPVLPIKTSSTCYYKQCSFCSHFTNEPYKEFNIQEITQTIKESNQKYFFLIDDMIPTKRLLKLAEKFKPLNIKWTCQLKPIKDLTYEILKTLKESGLDMIIWGVESGSNRILNLINKGTNITDIKQVLENSKKAGIKNVTYILYGFPTETKEEFLQTINFLKENSNNIDLISESVFGLQHGTKIYNNPKEFKIEKIIEEKRTILEPKITYEVSEGLTQKQATKLKENYKKTIEKLNKYPKSMNYFREHMLFME